MAISIDKKKDIVSELQALLSDSKVTIMVKYSGTPVKSMQALRKQAGQDGTQIKIVKNRLFKRALLASDTFKNIDVELLKGQLLYAFNSDDEAAPAKNIADCAKTEPQLEFICGLTQDGQILSVSDIKALASLPGKDQLRAQLLGTLSAPTSQFVNVMAANLRGFINVLNAHSESAN